MEKTKRKYGVIYKDKDDGNSYYYFPQFLPERLQYALDSYRMNKFEDSTDNFVFVELEDGWRIPIYNKVGLNTEVGNKVQNGHCMVQVAEMSHDYRVDYECQSDGQNILNSALKEFNIIIDKMIKDYEDGRT